MDPLLVDLGRAVDNERLRQARLSHAARRVRTTRRTTRTSSKDIETTVRG